MSALPSQPRIRIPRSARAGEVIEIRTLIEHPMETGLRN
jgi:sulfur-oxidizing protein SoxZ